MGLFDSISRFFLPEEDVLQRNIGRNDACWCGSQKKYKKCHLEEDERKLRAKQSVHCGKT